MFKWNNRRVLGCSWRAKALYESQEEKANWNHNGLWWRGLRTPHSLLLTFLWATMFRKMIFGWIALRQYSVLSTHPCLVLASNLTQSSQLSPRESKNSVFFFFRFFVVWKLFWTCLLVLAAKVNMLGNARSWVQISSRRLLPAALLSAWDFLGFCGSQKLSEVFLPRVGTRTLMFISPQSSQWRLLRLGWN